MAALDLVREEVGKATRQIQQAGGAEMSRGNMALAKKAIGYIDKLDEFMMQVEDVGEKWTMVQKALDADLESVKDVVLPRSVRNVKPGYTRKVDDVAPWTNFTARINGGKTISEPTARASFVEVLKYFDLDMLAKFGCMVNGEPLLSKDKSVFKKYVKADTKSVLPVKDGWFVNVYSSTATKVRLLSEFAKACGVKIELNVVPHASSHRVAKEPTKSVVDVRPSGSPKYRKDKPNDRVVDGVPYKVSQVVRACFPVVFERGLVTEEEVVYLQKAESSRKFRTGGNPVLKLDRGNDEDRIVIAPTGFKKARFYPSSKVSLKFAGKKYYLSCEFAPNALVRVVEWLVSKGFTKRSIVEIVENVK